MVEAKLFFVSLVKIKKVAFFIKKASNRASGTMKINDKKNITAKGFLIALGVK